MMIRNARKNLKYTSQASKVQLIPTFPNSLSVFFSPPLLVPFTSPDVALLDKDTRAPVIASILSAG